MEKTSIDARPPIRTTGVLTVKETTKRLRRQERVLITSPSLNYKDNVSGISSLVGDIMKYSKFPFLHFILGSKDRSKKGPRWVLKQFEILFSLLIVCSLKKISVVHLNVSFETFSIVRDSLVFTIVKRLFRKKVIVHFHGGYYLTRKPSNPFLRFLLKQLFHGPEALIVLSGLEKEMLETQYGNLPFQVLPNAVDTSFVPVVKERKVGTSIRIVFMGRLNATKGLYTISESFRYLSKHFHQFSFHIYGEGPESKRWLQSLAAIRGLQYQYHGVCDGSTKWNALLQSDVFLLPALHSEGMPIAMLEAMAAGCVVIVNDVASIKSVVQHQRNGFILEDHSPQTLASQIKDVLEDRVDILQVGEEASNFITQAYSIESYIEKLEAIYKAVIAPTFTEVTPWKK